VSRNVFLLKSVKCTVKVKRIKSKVMFFFVFEGMEYSSLFLGSGGVFFFSLWVDDNTHFTFEVNCSILK